MAPTSHGRASKSATFVAEIVYVVASEINQGMGSETLAHSMASVIQSARLEVFDEGSKSNVVHSIRILDEATQGDGSNFSLVC